MNKKQKASIYKVFDFISNNPLKSKVVIARRLGISREECEFAIEKLLYFNDIQGNKKFDINYLR
ncbi:MAG: hypothetical protein Q7U36_04310 [bacterium]|nr:hypothetical protein [bacterium]